MNFKYARRLGYNWGLIISELKERTGKEYTRQFIYDVMAKRKVSKRLKDNLIDMDIWEEK